MLKLYYALPGRGPPDLVSFMESLDSKLRSKLLKQFYVLMTQPLPTEPTVKHFTIEKYGKLYELRARSQVMVRIIFTIQSDGSILFLAPFIKKHTRNTMQALDSSLKMLAQIQSGACGVKEIPITQLLKGAENGE
jgi:mRNA-degrading endonuclease RelE of RelBE toxin-antitoxin system